MAVAFPDCRAQEPTRLQGEAAEAGARGHATPQCLDEPRAPAPSATTAMEEEHGFATL